jgi:methylenetetrahydrofolate dehydrogenase (NADP+)/methenyltetrahydrofolate cyclohydrolase
MAAKIIYGSEIARQIRDDVKKGVVLLKEHHGIVPGLVTILVGQNPASVSYVTGKQKMAHELGFYSLQDIQPEDMTEAGLLERIAGYNADPKIHGILVQLPLPEHIDEMKILCAIDPRKDVDGFHPFNVGKLMLGQADFLPCTPAGIQQLYCERALNQGGGCSGCGTIQYRGQAYCHYAAAEGRRGQMLR